MKYKVDYADDTLENKERALRLALGTLVETQRLMKCQFRVQSYGLTRLLVPGKLSFPSNLTNRGVVPVMKDRWRHIILSSVVSGILQMSPPFTW